MKFIFSAIVFSIFSTGFSQGWRTIDQSGLNVKYKLPGSWEVDGFGGGVGYWEEAGSSVCSCAGTINFAYNRTLGMVIYPFTATSDMTTREYIWDYHLVPATQSGSYATKKLSFTKTISKWKKENPADYDLETLNAEVWMFKFTGPEYGWIVYFWAEPTLLHAKEKTIYMILDSFTQVKG
jgi:hypothetical protein